MGTGDWNDGMNRVGREGRGESVWLAWFLHDVLVTFADVARGHGDEETVRLCTEEAEKFRANIEAHAWDGAWYRRAYFDDGTPLGSSANEECRIDSISQSWAVISGAGETARAAEAMNAVDRLLVKRDAGLVKLLDPPFDTSTLDPGYIKDMSPAPEKRGQYTHAAVWAAMPSPRWATYSAPGSCSPCSIPSTTAADPPTWTSTGWNRTGRRRHLRRRSALR